MTKILKFINVCFFAILCLQSTLSLAQAIGSMTNFNGSLHYTNLTNGSVVLANTLLPTSPAINGLIQPTGMYNNNGFLYICQRNNPTRIYNNAYGYVGNLTISGFPNISPTTNNADNISFIPGTNPQEAFVLRRGSAGQPGDISRIRFTNPLNAVVIFNFPISTTVGLPPQSLAFDTNNVYVTCNNNTNTGQIITLNAGNLTQPIPTCNVIGFNPRFIVISNGNLVVSGDNSIISGGTNSGTRTGYIRTIRLSTILAGSCCPDFNDITRVLNPCETFFGHFLINPAGNQLTNILTNNCVIPFIDYNPTPSNASGQIALSNTNISVAASASNTSVNVPFTISQILPGTPITVTLGRRNYNSAGTWVSTTNLPSIVVSGAGSFVYGDVLPPSTGGSRYEYFVVNFNWQGAVCTTISPNIFTVNVVSCNGTGHASILQSSTTVSPSTTSVSVPVTVSFTNLTPSNTPFNLWLGIRYINDNNVSIDYPHTYFPLNNGSSAVVTHNLTINIPGNQTGRYQVYVASFNWNQMCGVTTSNNFYTILVPCTPSITTPNATVSISPCNLQVDFLMPCRQGTFAVELYPQSAGGVPFSNTALIIPRTLATQPTGNSIELSVAGLVGTYYVRVVTSNPTIISSNYQTITIPSSEVSLLCSAIRIETNQIVLPIQVTGFTPTPATPLTVTVKREPSGQLITTTFSALPYEMIDNNPTSLNTSYTYTITSATANVCNLIAVDSCSITTPNIICGGDLWGKDTDKDNGTECGEGGTLWQSPDIWLSPNANAFFDDKDQAPVVGGTNYVYVRVRNRGTAPDAGKLRLYWAAASTGLEWSASWTGGSTCSVSGTPLGGEITSVAVSDNGMSIAGGDISQGINETRVYRFAWAFPNPADYADCFFNTEPVDNHHFCLLARIEQPADGVCRTQNLPKNENSDTGHNTNCNNNIFWQNITVLDGGGRGGNLNAGVIVRGTCVTSSAFSKVASTKTVANVTDKAVSPCLDVLTKFTWTEGNTQTGFFNYGGQLAVNLGQDLYNLWTAQGQQGSGVYAVYGSTYVNIQGSGAYIAVNLAPNESYGMKHWFIPTSRICADYDIVLTQSACVPTATGFCVTTGGETFSLRNFCKRTPKGGGGGGGLTPDDIKNIASRADTNIESIDSEVIVYPNPAKNMLNVNLGIASKVTTIQASLTDLMGRTVITAKEYNVENGSFNLDISHLVQGVYVFEMYINSQKVAKKIVKE